MNQDEIWKPVALLPWGRKYEVSNLGRVRGEDKIVKQIVARGYASVRLRWGNQSLGTGVHRLVAMTFIRPPMEGEVVNHKNFDRGDNRPENLEWTTTAENLMYSRSHGRFPQPRTAKIDKAAAWEMFRGGTTVTDIAKHFGCSIAAVSALFKRAHAFEYAELHGTSHLLPRRLDHEAIADRYLRGMHVKDIAAELGCSIHGVQYPLQRAGLYKGMKLRIG